MFGIQNHGLLVATETIESTVSSSQVWKNRASSFVIFKNPPPSPPNLGNHRCRVQLLADAAAAGRGINTVKISEEAEATGKLVDSLRAGCIAGIPSARG